MPPHSAPDEGSGYELRCWSCRQHSWMAHNPACHLDTSSSLSTTRSHTPSMQDTAGLHSSCSGRAAEEEH